jgi:hypothetical protein
MTRMVSPAPAERIRVGTCAGRRDLQNSMRRPLSTKAASTAISDALAVEVVVNHRWAFCPRNGAHTLRTNESRWISRRRAYPHSQRSYKGAELTAPGMNPRVPVDRSTRSANIKARLVSFSLPPVPKRSWNPHEGDGLGPSTIMTRKSGRSRLRDPLVFSRISSRKRATTCMIRSFNFGDHP